MKKILFTWWTHVWKTSVLEYLESQGYFRYISVAGANMKMLRSLLWEDRYPEYRKENFKEFQYANIYDDLKLYHQSSSLSWNKDDTVFFDRWVFDRIASLKREWYKIDASIEELVSKINYDLIFVFEPILEHNLRIETARLLNREVSEKWADFIKTEYTQRGWKIIFVPNFEWVNVEESIKKRAEFVLNKFLYIHSFKIWHKYYRGIY